jgi:hypothetical protein
MLLLIMIVCIQSMPAGDEEDPEIEDEVGEAIIPMYDIISAWFFEKQDQPEYLFTAMKLRDLSNQKGVAVYSMRWSYLGKEYVCGLDTSLFKDNIYRSGDPKRATTWQWKSMPECEGTYDTIDSIITWKIPKSSIGNPEQGDILEETRAHAVPGFPYNFLYFLIGRDYRDFAPQQPNSYGRDYVIQY